MLTAKEVIAVYEMLLSSPGMAGEVKINLKLPRKNVLILTKVIENGLANMNDDEGQALLKACNSNVLEEIKNLSTEILSMAGLTESYNKLNSFQVKP